MSVRFSIIIPYHNGHDTIDETIASVNRQCMKSSEIIVVDDRSHRHARSHLNMLALSNKNIRVYSSPKKGPSSARNKGASEARGEILCFLDADDCLRKDALNTYHDLFIKNPTLGVSFGRVRITKSPKLKGGIITPICESLKLEQLIGENFVCTTSNIVVRRQAFEEIGRFNEELTHAEDQEWLGRAFLNSKWVLKGINSVTVDYRTSPEGLSSDLKKMERGWRKMIMALASLEVGLTDRQKAKAGGLFYRYLARRALRLGASRHDGLGYMMRALAFKPSLLFFEMGRTWSTLVAVLAVFFIGQRPLRRILK